MSNKRKRTTKAKSVPARLKTEENMYTCPTPGCGNSFTAASLRKNKMYCSKCNTPLKSVRTKRQDAPGFRIEYQVDSSKEIVITVNPADVMNYKVHEEGYNFTLERADKPSLARERGEPEYIKTYRNIGGQTNIYCPGCGAYMYTSQVIKSGGTHGTINKCKRRLSGSTCNVITRVVFS